MVWTTLALLSLVILGGFISYYGDLQGRRWGKKRVSWFGMRPKHTAILITSLTGAFISLLSVVTVLLIVPPVRDVVLRGERAIEDNKRLNQQVTDGLEQTKINQYNYDRKLAATNAKYTKTQQDVRAALGQLAPLNRQIALQKAQNERLDLASRQKQKLLAALTEKQGVLTRANTQLAHVNVLRATQNHELSKQNYSIGQANIRLAASNTELTAKNNTLIAQNAGLTKASGILYDQNKSLLDENKRILQQSSEALGQLDTARAELARVKAQYIEAQNTYEKTYGVLADQGSQWGLNYVAIRQGRISVRVGSELARRSLDAHMSARAVREQLQQLLQDASNAAQRYGAEVGTNGRAVRIVSKLVPTLTGAEEADEGDSLNALISNLEGHSQPAVVVARAFSNTLEGEQAPIELRAIDIDPVFTPGQVLATRHIDASRPDGEVQQAIAQFLQTDVRAAAIKAGTIPQVDPLTGVSEVGKVDPLDLARLVGQARRMGGDLTIRAVATAPTTSADPLDRQHLRLDFQRTQGT